MGRKERNIKHSILIVYEGENTEPKYFESIREKIHSENIWGNSFSLEILPRPRTSKFSEEKEENVHKSKRLQRSILNKPVKREIELDYSAEPIRFVREAQLEMSDGTYDEAWVVFDHDSRGEKFISGAFELAENDELGKVNIAFSSIAFEHWYLLHFERNIKAFVKSECRIRDLVLECNSGKHEKDCYGEKCLGGYLRVKEYLETSTKENFSFYALLEPKLTDALINAAWLRKQLEINFGAGTPYYKLNPYTNVDVLVKYLLKINREYFWYNINDEINIIDKKVRIYIDGNQFMITNVSNSAIIIPADTTDILNSDYQSLYSFDRKVIEPREVDITDISQLESPQYLKSKFGHNISIVYLGE